MRKSSWAWLLAGMLLAGGAQAAAFVNGDFETGTDPGGYATLSTGDTSITGWTVVGGNVDYIGMYWTAASGARSLDLSGSGTAGSGVEQTFDTVVGTTYDVTFSLAGNPEGAPTVKTVTVTAPGVSQDFTFDTTGHTTTGMGWTTETFSFTATGTSSTLSFTTPGATAYGPALDNVTVTARRPAPATTVPTLSEWGLVLMAGLAAVLAFAQGKRRRIG